MISESTFQNLKPERALAHEFYAEEKLVWSSLLHFTSRFRLVLTLLACACISVKHFIIHQLVVEKKKNTEREQNKWYK
jgi:hypothetical protein